MPDRQRSELRIEGSIEVSEIIVSNPGERMSRQIQSQSIENLLLAGPRLPNLGKFDQQLVDIRVKVKVDGPSPFTR